LYDTVKCKGLFLSKSQQPLTVPGNDDNTFHHNFVLELMTQ